MQDLYYQKNPQSYLHYSKRLLLQDIDKYLTCILRIGDKKWVY